MPTKDRVRKQARPRPSTKPVERGPKAKVPWSDEVGAQLKADRQARGVTRAVLAQACAVSQSRIRELEVNRDPKGRPTHPSPRLAKALASWFRRHPTPAPAEGACPTDEEMAEEARLAAEAGHPVPAEEVSA
jgi:transcriptional regulator with XRE-family HTH domain